jgi:hypothetical protein
MEVFIAALILVALCVFGLCFNIIFRKDGKFPETEVGHNKEMRKRGLICAKEEEIRMLRRESRKLRDKSCSDEGCGSCTTGCGPENL